MHRLSSLQSCARNKAERRLQKLFAVARMVIRQAPQAEVLGWLH